jgi:YebC/PmpR family DNA-binding regulatory protein
MSGHSKWATIKHKKGAADAKRGKAFSRYSKELMVAAKAGGSNPETNAALRTVIQKAKAVNMPSDNIDRAIKKGAGELDGGVTYEEIVYEGFAAGGVGLIAKVLTDNKNRSAAEIRHIFVKHGSNFAGQGAVTRGFERKGQIFVDKASTPEEKLMNLVLDAGADDMKDDGDMYEILTEPAKFGAVMDVLEKAGIKTQDSEISMVPLTLVPVNEVGVANSVSRFINDLEDYDDVQNVYTNMDISDEVADKMEK